MKRTNNCLSSDNEGFVLKNITPFEEIASAVASSMDIWGGKKLIEIIIKQKIMVITRFSNIFLLEKLTIFSSGTNVLPSLHFPEFPAACCSCEEFQ